MAQTTGSGTTSVATLEVKIGAGAYTSIAGSSNSVDTVTIERAIGGKGTLDGSEKLVTAGRQSETTVTVNAMYTETAGEALLTAIDAIKNASTIQVKWKPLGSSGASFNTAAGGKVTRVALPEADAENGEPLTFSFDVFCGGIETSIS